MSEPTILFYYPVATLLDKLKMHSTMVARMIPQGNDKLIFTSDETIFFHSEMVKNIRLVFGMFSKLSYGITDALILNQPSTDDSTDYRYGFYINNNDSIQQNDIDIVNGYVENLLIQMLLREWWLKCALPDPFKESTLEVKNLWSGLNDKIAPLFRTAPSFNASFKSSLSTINRETGVETVTE